MKKISFILSVLLVVFFVLPTKATVPVVTLPYTFDATHTYGEIDMDGDGFSDFYINYEPSGQYCRIRTYSPAAPLAGNNQNPPLSVPSTGGILAETGIVPTAVPLGANQPLTGIGPSYTSMLTKGTPIGSTPPSGTSWMSTAYFFENDYFASPLSSNFTDGVYSGYVGVYYRSSGNTYYGWLNVQIDEDGAWVKINSSGHASAPATPVPAGLNDPFSVPVPLVATLIGFSLIGGGVLFRRRNKK
jgi:hypothetical protein